MRSFAATALVMNSAALLCAAGCASAHAQGRTLDDAALAGVWGQALLNLSNTSLNGLDFTRISLDADILLSANFTSIKLGETTYAPRNGTGFDIDIGTLRFGRSDAGDAKRTVAITNPYLEFVWSGTGASREVLGMRLGFGGISGDIGMQLNSVSGSLLINAGSAGTIDSRNDPLGGKRWDGSCATASACTLLLSQVGAVTAGNLDGPSRDLFLSVLKQAVVFPTLPGSTGTTDAAQSGFWLNWRDRLTAANTTGAVPANTGKGP